MRGEVLGTVYFIERDDKGVLLTIPAEDDDFGVVGTQPWEDGLVHPHRTDATASADEDTQAGRDDGDRTRTEGLATAVAVVEDFTAWLRAEAGQFWLGPSHKPVDLGRFDLVDAERGGVVRNVSIPQDLTIVMSDPDAAATVVQIDAAIQHEAGDS